MTDTSTSPSSTTEDNGRTAVEIIISTDAPFTSSYNEAWFTDSLGVEKVTIKTTDSVLLSSGMIAKTRCVPILIEGGRDIRDVVGVATNIRADGMSVVATAVFRRAWAHLAEHLDLYDVYPAYRIISEETVDVDGDKPLLIVSEWELLEVHLSDPYEQQVAA